MSKRSSFGGESSCTIATTLDEEGPSPASMGHSSASSSVPMIQMPLDLISSLILPFIADRTTWNNVCFSSKELYRAGKNLTPPWPNTAFNLEGHVVDRAVAFSPSGSHLAFGTNLGIVHVWDRWGKETTLLGGSNNPEAISCLEYSWDGTYLASGMLISGSIRLWPIDSLHTSSTKTSRRETPTTIPVVDQADNSILLGNHVLVAVLAFSQTDTNLLASGGWNDEIKLWNIQEQACIYAFQTRQDNFIPSLFFAGGHISVCNAVMSAGSMIRLWRAQGSSKFTSETIEIPGGGGLYRRVLVGVLGAVRVATFSPCGSFLTIGYSTHSREGVRGTTIVFYELESMIKSQSLVLPGFVVTCSSVSPDSKTLILGDAQGRIRLFQTDDFSIQRDLNTRLGPPPPPASAPTEKFHQCVAFDPSCRVVAFGGGGRDGGRLELRTLS